jgi:hypothetical protein
MYQDRLATCAVIEGTAQGWATQQEKRINSIQFVEERFQLNSVISKTLSNLIQ